MPRRTTERNCRSPDTSQRTSTSASPIDAAENGNFDDNSLKNTALRLSRQFGPVRVGAFGYWGKEELADAIRGLPQRQREVVVLRYYLDLSEEQIAAWLGVSTGSVKRHAFRATAALQKRMEAWA